MNKLIGKKDLIVIASIIAVSVAAIFAMRIFAKGGNKAVIYVDNEEIKVLPLSEDTEYTVKTEYGTNIVVVSDGKVFVTEADCRDKICVNTGKKSEVGDIIVCLPHKMVVSVEE